MKISSIVAVADNNVIGAENDLPWRLSSDLKYFKKITAGHHIIMGRKNYQSIGFPLPKRTNIILSRNPFFIVSNCLVAQSIEEALSLAHDNGEKEVFIIGGAKIYEQTMDIIDTLYYTAVHAKPLGDTFFPEINWDEWKLTSEEKHQADERNEHDFTFKVFDRIT